MRKVILLLIATFFIALTACNKEKIDKVDPSDLIINTDKAELQTRIHMINQPVTYNNFKATKAVPTPPDLWAIAQIDAPTLDIHVWYWEDLSATYPDRVTYNSTTPDVFGVVWTPIDMYTPGAPPAGYDINEVELANQQLSMTAAGLAAPNNFASGLSSTAYFTSHIRGSVFGGEIFVVKYNPNPTVDDVTGLIGEVSIYDLKADYNDLTIDGADKLWIAGDNNARGAIVRYASLADLESLYTGGTDENLNTFSTMSEFNIPMIGPSGNSVTLVGDQAWVVAGGTTAGGLMVMHKTVADLMHTRMDQANAKHFDLGNVIAPLSTQYGVFLYGGAGKNQTDNDGAGSYLRVWDFSNGFTSYDTYGPNTDYGEVTKYGKNGIDVQDNYVYMAMGEDGVKKVILDASLAPATSAGDVTHSFNATTYGLLGSYGGAEGLANSLVVWDDYVYVAYGAYGLVILDASDLSFVAQWNGMGSCNYIAIQPSFTYNTTGTPSLDNSDDIMFLGNGTGGIIMLKFANDI